MFCPGDLIRVPSNVGLVKLDHLNIIDRYKVTEKPKMGIFVKYKDVRECIINTDGENWVVPLEYIRIMEKDDDKVNSNKQI
tara:strand:+ start:183 stop:425 length:243 start_codon:yes stop_codon:yes gene_type:complete